MKRACMFCCKSLLNEKPYLLLYLLLYILWSCRASTPQTTFCSAIYNLQFSLERNSNSCEVRQSEDIRRHKQHAWTKTAVQIPPQKVRFLRVKSHCATPLFRIFSRLPTRVGVHHLGVLSPPQKCLGSNWRLDSAVFRLEDFATYTLLQLRILIVLQTCGKPR